MHVKVWELLKRSYTAWRGDGAPQLAAALSYYAFLSVSPLLVILVAFLGQWFGREAVREQVLVQAERIVGGQGVETVEFLFRSASVPLLGTAASLVALLIALWGAMRFFNQLRDAFDRIWNIPPERPASNDWKDAVRLGARGLARKNLAAFLMVLIVGVLLLASLATSAGIDWLASAISPAVTMSAGVHRALEVAVSWLGVTLMFAAVYVIIPRTRIGWRDVWVGSAVTSLLFLLGRFLLAVYFSNATVGSAFGAAGTLVATLVWVNYTSQIVLLGAEFTHTYAYTYGSRAQRSAEEEADSEEPCEDLGAGVE